MLKGFKAIIIAIVIVVVKGYAIRIIITIVIVVAADYAYSRIIITTIEIACHSRNEKGKSTVMTGTMITKESLLILNSSLEKDS